MLIVPHTQVDPMSLYDPGAHAATAVLPRMQGIEPGCQRTRQ